MQKRRNAADQLESQKRREHEHPHAELIRGHCWATFPSIAFRETVTPAWSGGDRPSSSRTRGWTTSFPCVISVSRRIWSSRSIEKPPFLTSNLAKAVMLDEYIWLASRGSVEARLTGPLIVTPL